MPSTPIRIDDDILASATIASKANHRPLSKQIEYWTMIGQISEENPDLNFEAMRVLLQSEADLENDNVEAYEFRIKRRSA
ncbi:hypothetical protein WDW89_22875 [Deltaproteobacteria bacterium TL4]